MTDAAAELIPVLSPEEVAAIEHELTHVPIPAGAAIDALLIVQKHRGWVSDESLRAIAGMLEMSVDALDGIATFYNGIYRRPVGEKVILLCNSVSCWICGCDKVQKNLQDALGIGMGETTADGKYTLLTAPCLGACDRAPVMMVGDDLHANLDSDQISQIFRESVDEN